MNQATSQFSAAHCLPQSFNSSWEHHFDPIIELIDSYHGIEAMWDRDPLPASGDPDKVYGMPLDHLSDQITETAPTTAEGVAAALNFAIHRLQQHWDCDEAAVLVLKNAVGALMELAPAARTASSLRSIV